MKAQAKYFENVFDGRDAECTRLIAGGLVKGAVVLATDLNKVNKNNPFRELCNEMETITVLESPFNDKRTGIPSMVVYHKETNQQRLVSARNWIAM